LAKSFELILSAENVIPHFDEPILHQESPALIKTVLFGQGLVMVFLGKVWVFCSKLVVGHAPMVSVMY